MTLDDYLTEVADALTTAVRGTQTGAGDLASDSEEFAALADDVSNAWESQNGTDRFFAEFQA